MLGIRNGDIPHVVIGHIFRIDEDTIRFWQQGLIVTNSANPPKTKPSVRLRDVVVEVPAASSKP
jgi:hypothetical protein